MSDRTTVERYLASRDLLICRQRNYERQAFVVPQMFALAMWRAWRGSARKLDRSQRHLLADSPNVRTAARHDYLQCQKDRLRKKRLPVHVLVKRTKREVVAVEPWILKKILRES